jgi:menaquinone-dependent protoporphyrinogen IX oxidase
MNVWIVYDSKFGNNKRIADLLATHLKDMNNVHVAYAKTIRSDRV